MFKCKQCDNNFEAKRNDAFFCGKKCYHKNRSLANKDKLKEYKAKYYLENKQRIDENNIKNYHSKKPNYSSLSCLSCGAIFTPKRKDEKCCSGKCSINNWRNNNKDHINSYYRQKYKTQINYRICHNMRSRIAAALKKNVKSKSTKELLGCSIPDLIKHIESKFKPGMSWENYGHKGWHIDHIKPLLAEGNNLQDERLLKELCHYTNLQPLWCFENISKSNHIKE
jgi:hypothetical protein